MYSLQPRLNSFNEFLPRLSGTTVVIGHAGALLDHHEFVGRELNHGGDLTDGTLGVIF
jgi:hypothetical protein